MRPDPRMPSQLSTHTAGSTWGNARLLQPRLLQIDGDETLKVQTGPEATSWQLAEGSRGHAQSKSCCRLLLRIAGQECILRLRYRHKLLRYRLEKLGHRGALRQGLPPWQLQTPVRGLLVAASRNSRQHTPVKLKRQDFMQRYHLSSLQ